MCFPSGKWRIYIPWKAPAQFARQAIPGEIHSFVYSFEQCWLTKLGSDDAEVDLGLSIHAFAHLVLIGISSLTGTCICEQELPKIGRMLR
jgi:hypothetical protein